MESIYFSMPAKVYFERGGLEKHLPEIKNYGKKVLVVSGRNFIFKSGLHERISKILSDNGIGYAFYCEVNPEPEIDDAERGAMLCKKESCDCILAVGGGSAMDAGKAIAVLASNEGSARDYFGEVKYKKEPLPVIVVPSTCGTGSEVTRFAVLIDLSEQTKKTISSEKIIPKISIMDADLLNTLPNKLILATGMDAFSHSVESFLANKADYFSKLFAKESLKMLWELLTKACKEPGNKDFKEKIFLASMLGGLAINRTGTIVLHGIGYSLTTRNNVHHGTANAILLPYVLDYLKRNGYEKEMTELEEIWGDTGKLNNFVKGLGLPSTLKAIGITEKDIDELADLSVAGTVRSLKNMKIKMDRDDFKKILKEAL